MKDLSINDISYTKNFKLFIDLYAEGLNVRLNMLFLNLINTFVAFRSGV